MAFKNIKSYWKKGTCATAVYYDCVHLVVHLCLCLSINVCQNTVHQGMTAPRPCPAIYEPHVSC